MPGQGERFEVNDRLKDVLSHIYTASAADGDEVRHHRLVPNLEMMVVLNFGTPIRFSFGSGEETHHIERIGILGPLRRTLYYTLQPGARLLALPFIHNGFYRLFPTPLHELEHLTNPDDGLPPPFHILEEIWEQAALLPSGAQQAAFLETYLPRLLAENEAAALPLLEGIPDLHNPQINPVKSIAGKAGLTERSIQTRFRKYTGYSPKELVRFLRFKEVMQTLQAAPSQKPDWFELIVRFGYHDQSHLIKDFRYFTDISPLQFHRLLKEDPPCGSRE